MESAVLPFIVDVSSLLGDPIKSQQKSVDSTVRRALDWLRSSPASVASLGSFEVDLGEQDIYTDAVIPLGANDLYLEFHHLSPAHARAASISSYVMEKLRTYAIRHNLIPR